MPRAEHFGKSSDAGLLRLPRPEACPIVGGYCRLAGQKQQDANSSSVDAQLDGPMSFADYGYVLEDTGDAERPYKVQELESGHIWWYNEHMLQSVAEDQVPEQLKHPPYPDDGDYVTLVPNYKQCSDAGRGPLSLQRTDNAFGMIILASGNRFRVHACYPAGERAEWWYDREAVRKVHINYVPEHLRQPLRPGWGDYCVLTSDHAQFGNAADGPLEDGNLGVVVGVDHLSDAQGGLQHTRYCVRACHNGLLHRYHEGAVHPVVLQLLHDEKIPPGDLPARMDKLMVTLTLMEAPSGGRQSAVEAPRSLIRRMIPGSAYLSELACQTVSPGRKYWLQATMFCKDDDLMLASFKPTSWDLYAPCGITGEYRPLTPVDLSTWSASQQQQQQQQPYLTTTTQHQQHLCPEMLSLQACRAQTRNMQWGDNAGGTGKRAYEASCSKNSGLQGLAGRLADAGAGPGPWYCPYDDKLLGVWEWDSSEAPLVVTPGGVTMVHFSWDVTFADLQPRAHSTAPLFLQTTSNIADITAALTAAASSSSRQQQLPTVMFEHLARPPAPGVTTPSGRPTPSPGADAARAGSSSSSGSSNAAGDEDGGSDAGSNAGGSDANSERGEGEGEVEQEAQDEGGQQGREVGSVEGGAEEQQQGECREGATTEDRDDGDAAAYAAAYAAAMVLDDEDVGVDAGTAAAVFAAAMAAEAEAQAGSHCQGDAAAFMQQQLASQGSGSSNQQGLVTPLNSSGGSGSNAPPHHHHQQQQQQGDVEGLSLPQLVTTSSADWSFPILAQANSQDGTSGAFPDTLLMSQPTAAGAAVAPAVGPVSCPTSPLAGAGSSAASALAAAVGLLGDRRTSSGSGISTTSAPPGRTSSSSSSASRYRPRSLSCEGRRHSSSPRRGTLTGVAFTSLSVSSAAGAGAAAAGAAAAAGSSSAASTAPGAAAADSCDDTVPVADNAAVAAEDAAAQIAAKAAAAAAAAAADKEHACASSRISESGSIQSASEPATPAAAEGGPPGAARPAPAATVSSSGATGDGSGSSTGLVSLRTSSTGTGAGTTQTTVGLAAAGPSNGSGNTSASLPSSRALAAAAAAGVSEVRRPRAMPPVLPVLGPSSISSRDSVSSSERSARSVSTPPVGSSRSARPSSSSGSGHISRQGSGGTARTAVASSMACTASGGSTSRIAATGTMARTASGGSAPAGSTHTSRSATPRGSTTPTAQQQQLGPGMTSISEVMSQLERQAESRQPFWQEGTQDAADFAAKAYEAAVEWHQHWRRPGRM